MSTLEVLFVLPPGGERLFLSFKDKFCVEEEENQKEFSLFTQRWAEAADLDLLTQKHTSMHNFRDRQNKHIYRNLDKY